MTHARPAAVKRAVFAPTDRGRAAGTGLTWKHFPAGPNGFFRAPVLLSGPTEALLIDGGFTYPDGRALAEAIGGAAEADNEAMSANRTRTTTSA